jgi:hypothetical protein
MQGHADIELGWSRWDGSRPPSKLVAAGRGVPAAAALAGLRRSEQRDGKWPAMFPPAAPEPRWPRYSTALHALPAHPKRNRAKNASEPLLSMLPYLRPCLDPVSKRRAHLRTTSEV